MRYNSSIVAAFLLLLMFSLSAWAAEVPLGESGGIYTVPVQVNQSVELQFLVDPGSAVVVIPRSVLDRLILNGTVRQDDVVGVSVAELADRSLYKAVQLRLRELRVGGTVVRDVIAAVAPALSQPLLGQSFLKRFASVTFDNRRRVLILSDSGLPAAPQYPATSSVQQYYPPYPTIPPSPYAQPGYWAPGR